MPPELVCELEVPGGLEPPLDEVPGLVLGRVPGLEVCEEVVLGAVVDLVDGEVVPGLLLCRVDGTEDVFGIVPVVVGGIVLDAVEDVDGGGAGVEPCTQRQALLTRAVLLSQPDR